MEVEARETSEGVKLGTSRPLGQPPYRNPSSTYPTQSTASALVSSNQFKIRCAYCGEDHFSLHHVQKSLTFLREREYC